MQITLRRFNGACSSQAERVEPIDIPASPRDIPASPRDIAKSALERFYDFGKASFRAKLRFERNAPEEAIVTDGDGRRLGAYSIRDIVADRRLYLTVE
jgi:hypothetical protein